MKVNLKKTFPRLLVLLILATTLLSSCARITRSYGPVAEADYPPIKYGFINPGNQPGAYNQAWEYFLRGKGPDGNPLKNKNGSLVTGKHLSVYPNPRKVTDKGLQVIGYMGEKQGLPYALGGGHLDSNPGTSPGTVAGHQDFGKMGMDCTGLIRYAFYLATGIDLHKVTGSNKEYLNRSDTIALFDYFKTFGKIVGRPQFENTSKLANVLDLMLPGDIIIYEQNGVGGHAGVYVGNGQTVETDVPGTTAHFAELSKKPRTVTVFRPDAYAK